MRIYLSLFLVFSAFALLAQQDPAQQEEDLLEFFFLNNEQATEADAQVFLDQLEFLRANKINLNTANFQELTSSNLLNPVLAQNLLAYRKTLGALVSIHELQAVPGWTLDDVRRILPYAEAGNLDTRVEQRNLWSLIKSSKKDALFRYVPAPSSLPTNVEGSKHGYAVRLRATAQGRLRMGILAEQDPGEAFFKGSNKQGFDHYSAYFFLKNSPEKRLKALALGDYQVRLGQGLILFSGLAFGKSPNTTLVIRGGDAIGPFTSIAEGLSMRGGAATIRLNKHLDATMFVSSTRRDANLSFTADSLLGGTEEIFTALQTSGLHRTASELEDEKVLRETATGASVKWSNRTTELAAQSVVYHFAKPWQPSPAPYRAFVFTGQTQAAASVSYRTIFRNLIPFGETAVSQNGGLASTNGVVVSPDRKVSIAILHRYLAPNYQNINANPFADGSSGNNESGIYCGIELRPKKGWTINTYADIWRHPWLRFNADLPSEGQDMLLRLSYVKKRSFSAYAQLQSKKREQNYPSDISEEAGLAAARRTGLRLHAEQIVTPRLILRSRVEHTWFDYAGFETTRGFMAYTEVVMKRSLSIPIGLSARYVMFDAVQSENRIYTYEQDVTAAFSVPPLSGRGSRAYLNLRYDVMRNLILEGRIARTYYAQAATDSQEIGNNWFYRLQVRMVW
jgi:hypothetical protein